MKALVLCDVVDAASYVGATRFERAAAMFTILTGEIVDIAYRAASPSVGLDSEQAAAAAKISGLDLNLDELVAADSTDAWRLLTWASETGDAVQRDLIQQLWRAHFLEGTDIADHLVLAGRAAVSGLPLPTADALLASQDYAPEVERQRETAASIGASDLPFIVVNDNRTLAGLQSQDDYLQALHQIHRDAIQGGSGQGGSDDGGTSSSG